MKFSEFNFNPKLAQAIDRAGFKEASAIQREAIPHILEGKDIVGQAHTGTGKTAAFALPTLNLMKGDGSIEILVIVPTRELAIQVADEYYRFSRNLNIRTATAYGGMSYKRQVSHIENAGVLVATPGRLLDLLSAKKITINPSFVVLDEADEMLNMGFLEDVRNILKFFPNRTQTLLFSATISSEIKNLAETIQKKPLFIRTEQETVTKNSIEQYYYVVEEYERDEAIIRLLEVTDPKKAIIFCRTKRETARLCEFLSGQGYSTEALHGDVDQWGRQKIMKGFRNNEFEILVATDVASRGIDVRGVSHVFNYQIPLESDSYVHRIGRTGRAEKDGVAMMLVTPHELYELERIKKDVGSELILQAIPHKHHDPMKQIEELSTLIQQKKVGKEAAVLLSKVSNGFSPEVVAEKLLMILAERTAETAGIGKTISEVETIVAQKASGSDRGSSSSKRSSSRSRSSSSSSRSSRNSKRGGSGRSSSSRSESIPVPDITKTASGARIIARKLY